MHVSGVSSFIDVALVGLAFGLGFVLAQGVARLAGRLLGGGG